MSLGSGLKRPVRSTPGLSKKMDRDGDGDNDEKGNKGKGKGKDKSKGKEAVAVIMKGNALFGSQRGRRDFRTKL
jgi:hypothetical protein